MLIATKNNAENKGVWYAVGAYLIWGFFPLYWELLNQVPVLQVLGHRIFWSFLFLFGLILVTRQGEAFKNIALNWRFVGIYSLAAILIAIHWLTFVWAVGAGFVVEISLGYFINPLLSVLLGVVIMRERLRALQWIPIGIAALGVIYLTFEYGALPWVSLTLATSFGIYGLVKKIAPLRSIPGLAIESGILFLPAFGFLLFSELQGQGAFLHMNLASNLLLAGAGLVTTIPLLLFSSAAQSVPLTTIGVLQYIEPTMQFLLGVLIFREPFSLARLAGFVIVWAAIIIYVIEGLYAHQRLRHPVIVENRLDQF